MTRSALLLASMFALLASVVLAADSPLVHLSFEPSKENGPGND